MPIGVIIKKKMKNIIIGEKTFPNNIPNLNHKLFKGFKRLEFVIPSIKNIKDNIKDHILNS